ncbi:hypothetical protein BHM03_00007929 [Ensete ventricosum]|nr:hypothetical protein BHM03_00007929 [Ensete ventricosum]
MQRDLPFKLVQSWSSSASLCSSYNQYTGRGTYATQAELFLITRRNPLCVVKAAQARVPVFRDGGVRRGTDVFKALALGASSVFVSKHEKERFISSSTSRKIPHETRK